MTGMVILGSGQSAKFFRCPHDLKVIAVNGAIERALNPDYFFTLDPSKLNIERIKNKRSGVEYYAAFDVETARKFNRDKKLKILKRISRDYGKITNDNSPRYWLQRWGSVQGLSEDSRLIHTGNSAYGALGLAYHLGATRVLLVGVDGTQEERLEGGTPNNLSHLPLLFKSALDQIEIASVGSLKGIPQKDIKSGLEWLRSAPIDRRDIAGAGES